MTSKDVARDIMSEFIQGHEPGSKALLFADKIEQALQAHGEAEYRRGLEDAAQVAELEGRSWDPHSPDPQTRIALKIRALKPKGDNE